MQQLTNLTHDVVLIGGGHAHALVLRDWGMDPVPGARLTVINPGPTAPYTGMLPGFVAGHYKRDDLDIDLVRLARFAGARLVLGAVNDIDLDARHVHVPGRPAIPYDVMSVDIGITSSMPRLPGFAEHGVAAKPLDVFADRWDRFRTNGTGPIAVIGGGVAGVELAMAMAHACPDRAVTLLERSRALNTLGSRARDTLLSRMKGLGITLREGSEVTAIGADNVVLSDGETLPVGLVVGAAGARPYDWLQQTGLPLTDGFIDVDRTLRVMGQTGVFAVGDCAHMVYSPRPKAGVFAVRAAPILLENLRAEVSGKSRKIFAPQSDFLKLISLGKQEALAEKAGFTFKGAMMWKIKDRIDRSFMDRLNELPVMAADTPMLCGGCGAKVGPDVLKAALAQMPSGTRPDILSRPGDDAAVVEIGGQKQVLTTDHLRAVTDDPYRLARIAAVHALGDIWAMGAMPQAVLTTLILPRMTPAMQAAVLDEIMTGASEIFSAEGAEIVGGHTTMGAEMTIGFSITGLVDKPITLDGAKAGDHLYLTKPIGTGTLLAAEMAGAAKGDDIGHLLDAMAEPQGKAAAALKGARAMTDVTGFGLAGHLMALLEASGVAAEIQLDALPFYPGAEALSAAGVRSTLYPENEIYAVNMSVPNDPRIPLFFDPQTAGGLLAAVPPEMDLNMKGMVKIGEITAGTPHIKVV